MREPAYGRHQTLGARALSSRDHPYVLFALDAEGRFTASEGEGLAALGLKPGQVVGRFVFDVYREEPKVLESVKRVLAGESFSAMLGVSGTVFRCQYNPLRDAGGRVLGVVGLATEVVEDRRVAEEMRLPEQALAASSEGIVVTDPNLPDDPIVYANAAFETMTGYLTEEVLGRNCRFLQGADRDQAPLRVLRNSLLEGRECQVVLRNYRKDGTPFYNELSVSPVYGEDGRLIHFVGVQKDVTERVRREEELAESEERFRATFEAAGVGMAHVAPDGHWLRINGKLSEITGYSRDELQTLTFQDITHLDDLEKDLEHVNRMLLGEIETYSMEKRYVRKDGRRVWVELTVSSLRSASGGVSCFVSVIEDITERKLAELLEDPLSERELQVLNLIARRRTNEQIARELRYSLGMIRHHVGNVLRKLNAKNRTAAAEWAIENGLIPPPR